MRPLRSATVALLAVAALLSCTSDRTDEVSGPRPHATVVPGGYTLIEDRLSASQPLEASRIIGLEGGRIDLAGHSIEVPFGAVNEPAVFTIRLVTNGYVEVDLTALAGPGGVIDIGGGGFAVPVKLTLTYARATNVADPARLLILRKLGPGYFGSYEALPSVVNPSTRTVEANLEHFSSYVMADG